MPNVTLTVEDFSHYKLSNEEFALLMFVYGNSDSFGESFTPHDVSVAGHVASSGCYSRLYDKGLFNKPSRGVYTIDSEAIDSLIERKCRYLLRLEGAQLRKALINFTVLFVLSLVLCLYYGFNLLSGVSSDVVDGYVVATILFGLLAAIGFFGKRGAQEEVNEFAEKYGELISE